MDSLCSGGVRVPCSALDTFPYVWSVSSLAICTRIRYRHVLLCEERVDIRDGVVVLPEAEADGAPGALVAVLHHVGRAQLLQDPGVRQRRGGRLEELAQQDEQQEAHEHAREAGRRVHPAQVLAVQRRRRARVVQEAAGPPVLVRLTHARGRWEQRFRAGPWQRRGRHEAQAQVKGDPGQHGGQQHEAPHVEAVGHGAPKRPATEAGERSDARDQPDLLRSQAHLFEVDGQVRHQRADRAEERQEEHLKRQQVELGSHAVRTWSAPRRRRRCRSVRASERGTRVHH